MHARYNLEVEKPEDVAVVLETAANFYREQKDGVWHKLASALNKAAELCRKEMPLTCATCPEGSSGPWCNNCNCG